MTTVVLTGRGDKIKKENGIKDLIPDSTIWVLEGLKMPKFAIQMILKFAIVIQNGKTFNLKPTVSVSFMILT